MSSAEISPEEYSAAIAVYRKEFEILQFKYNELLKAYDIQFESICTLSNRLHEEMEENRLLKERIDRE